jgi:hypothetical protein
MGHAETPRTRELAMTSTQEKKPEEKPHPLSQAEIAAKLEEFWRLFYEFLSKPD